MVNYLDMKNKFFIKTFGCQMNISDSERIESVLLNAKFKKVYCENLADFVIVNSCSVRQAAENRAISTLKLARKNKQVAIITGCSAVKEKKRFENFADFVLDIKDLKKWPSILPCPWQGSRKKRTFAMGKVETNYFKINPNYSSKFHAYVPIMTGCNNFCSYCVVPYSRGREVSRPVNEILDEVKFLLKHGYNAITLLGQNVNSYKGTISNILISEYPKIKFGKYCDFATLLKLLNLIENDYWIWFVTSHPKDMSLKLIKTIKSCKKVCHYIHLPAQAGNDLILEKMNRKYTHAKYLKLVKLIKKNLSDVCLSTDIIVGFPGETKKQFLDTCKLFKEVKYDMAFLAKYSPRPGTISFKMKDNVLMTEKKRRENYLNDILRKTALNNNKKYLGKTVDILVEKKNLGRTKTFKLVKFESDKDLIGQIVKAKITKSLAWILEGEIKN
ncbi:MAG: tRNA (N6-isopentenyl adenosine(37)-C2)-methylthiotransferase MiaB [Patescibacteria group bacterium]|jgi:tRNA-2-methylthio-N6-dimethylallyladenosine synthase